MRYDAVLFDLLSALLDSWSLWEAVAGEAGWGDRWRRRHLELTAAAGAYRPPESIMAEAASDVRLPDATATRLLERWGSVRPWPEAAAVLEALAGSCGTGVVTNCSDAMAAAAVRAIGVPVGVVVTAEAAGWYKPHPAPYRAALDALDLPADRVLYVAGSRYDVVGAGRAGLAVYWHNRRGFEDESAPRAASWVARTLSDVPAIVAGRGVTRGRRPLTGGVG